MTKIEHDKMTLALVEAIVQQHSLIIENNTDILRVLNKPMYSIDTDSKINIVYGDKE